RSEGKGPRTVGHNQFVVLGAATGDVSMEDGTKNAKKDKGVPKPPPTAQQVKAAASAGMNPGATKKGAKEKSGADTVPTAAAGGSKHTAKPPKPREEKKEEPTSLAARLGGRDFLVKGKDRVYYPPGHPMLIGEKADLLAVWNKRSNELHATTDSLLA